MQRSVLVVEDDVASQRLLQRFFERKNWRVHLTASAQEALSLYMNSRPGVVLLDIQLPTISGLDLLEILRERDPDAVIVMITGHADVETAVTAMRSGAENFLVKPVSLDHLEVVVEHALEKAALRRSNRVMADRQLGASPLTEALERSPALQELHTQIDRMAGSDATVLLQGETGTGKSWVAKAVHCRSPRSHAPFVDVNCASLSAEGLQKELFGEERLGARGKRVATPGLFEQADGGTLFLDEIGMLDPELQPMLLRVLETKRFRRQSGNQDVEVDVRVIAATNLDLEKEVRANRFREDLYYRLAVVMMRMTPLRERLGADIISIARELLDDVRRHAGNQTTPRISPEAEDLLIGYAWPGNIREMRNALERIMILHPGIQEIRPEHLPAELRSQAEQEDDAFRLDPTLPLEEIERLHIVATLKHFRGNRSQAARSLGIARRTLYDKIEKYGLEALSAESS